MESTLKFFSHSEQTNQFCIIVILRSYAEGIGSDLAKIF